MYQSNPVALDPDGYSLGNGDSELARLILQAEFLQDVTERLVDRIGVRPGSRTLDLGCGPLGALHILADRVGAENVVGVDRDPGFLGTARKLLDRRGFHGVQLVHSDATSTGLEPDSFDLVHERTLIINSPRPVDVITEMVRLSRPGGYVALQDFDVAGLVCVPAHPDYERLMAAAAAVWSGDMFIGRRLTQLLSAAGLVDIHVDVHVFWLAAGDPHYDMMLDFFELHRARILAANHFTPDEFEASLQRTRHHFGNSNTRIQYGPFFQAWGRKR